MPNNKYGALDKGKSFGPGHDGWYEVRKHNKLNNDLLGPCVKAKSAFQAAAKCGCSLTECTVIPITDEETIAKLEEKL
jgi:hypothetical protein